MVKRIQQLFDTVIVSAHHWGWNYLLLENNMWNIKRIDEKNLKKIKFIAFFQTAPINAITSYAKVKKINYNWELSHYDVYLSGKLIFIKPLKLDDDNILLRPIGTKYTLLNKLLNARKLSDLINK